MKTAMETAMGDFETAVNFVLKEEGGLVDDPRDPGGLTNMGISLRAHPELTRDEIIHMTVSRAKEIYGKYYWYPMLCGSMADRPALAIFDCAVNQGPQFATMAFCKVLGIEHFPMSEDLALAISQMNEREFLIRFMHLRVERYFDIVYCNIEEAPFLTGWMHRMAHLFKVLGLSK